MLLPSDNWCAQRYFTQSFDNQGSIEKVSDYQRAFTEDIELPQVISKIGGVLTSMGYGLKDAEMEIKSIKVKQAEDNAMSSKTSSASIAESPLDVLKRRMKSDIVIQLWWNITKDHAGKIVSFSLEAFDSYTNKRIATATGNSKPSTEAIPVALERAVKDNIKEFDKQLDNGMMTKRRMAVRLYSRYVAGTTGTMTLKLSTTAKNSQTAFSSGYAKTPSTVVSISAMAQNRLLSLNRCAYHLRTRMAKRWTHAHSPHPCASICRKHHTI